MSLIKWKGIHVCNNFYFQAEDGIRDSVASRGLGDVYERQPNVMGWGSLTKV